MKKHRSPKTQRTTLSVFVFGILFSFLTLVILSFISSFILISVKNPLSSIKLTSLLVLLAAGAISGIAITKYKGDFNLVISIAASVSVAAVMLAVALISSRGSVGGGIFMNYLCYVLTYAFFSFVGRKRRVRRRR